MATTLSIKRMQARVNQIVATSANSREAIAQAQADKTITELCREIIQDAAVRAWTRRQAHEIERFMAEALSA